MTEFFQTMMGKQFFDATMPRIARSIEALNETVKGLNARLDINQKHDKEFIEKTFLNKGAPDIIYVNGVCHVKGAMPIEPDFKKLMGA